jgi:peptidoglycan hydrolase-like protein with peptidoglycan-binding domain
MAKKQTRRSISVSGDTYNAVRDYCDVHGLSASGLVTDLLDKYLVDNAAGPPPGTVTAVAPDDDEDAPREELKTEPADPQVAVRSSVAIQIQPPQAARDVKYPDRRGPGFTPLPEGKILAVWRVTAQIEIARKRQIDAQTSVETLLQNLVHRRMVSGAAIVRVEQLTTE